ncbi:MAG: hypothetical protein SGJ19_26265 [Planctomycetia bacterium]|nr:hypothetical protein [Planctomycetia bacterium]
MLIRYAARNVNRLQLSIIVGIVCAVLLTMIRGSWRDAPFVVPIFGAAGFSATYAIAFIIRSERIAKIEAASKQRRGVPLLRNAAAFALVAVSFIWSGHVIQGAGFGGWLVAIFLGVVFPLAVCLLASHWPVVFGLLAATSLAISTLLNHPNFRQNAFARDAWEQFWQRDAGVWVFIWGVLAVLSLFVSVPLALRRRRLTSPARQSPA